MVLYFQRGYDQLKVEELHTSINRVLSSGASTVASTTTTLGFLWKLTATTNQTINLPSAVGLDGRMFIFYKTQSGGTVTIDPSGSETIDGSSTATISTQYGTITIISDGANWLIV